MDHSFKSVLNVYLDLSTNNVSGRWDAILKLEVKRIAVLSRRKHVLDWQAESLREELFLVNRVRLFAVSSFEEFLLSKDNDSQVMCGIGLH